MLGLLTPMSVGKKFCESGIVQAKVVLLLRRPGCLPQGSREMCSVERMRMIAFESVRHQVHFLCSVHMVKISCIGREIPENSRGIAGHVTIA